MPSSLVKSKQIEFEVGSIPPSAIGGGALSEVMSFASGGSKHVNSTSPTYESLAHIIYGGSAQVGDIVTINVNAWVNGTGTADVRVVDLNTGLTIAQLIGISSMLESNIQSMGAITNLPTTATAFEIQGRKVTGGGGVKLLIAGIQSLY